jgi:hypothetical protein
MEVRLLWDPTPQESPIFKGAQSLLELNVGGSPSQICNGAQSMKQPNLFGTQSLFDINPQERPTLEEANPFGAQSLLELNVRGNLVFVGAYSSREPNP